MRRSKPRADGRRFSLNDHGDAELQGEKAGGVVEEAFAFEDGDDLLREAEARGDGGGGDSVGSSNDGPKDEAEAEIKRREGPVSGLGYTEDGESDETECEQRDANDVVGEVAPTGEPCGRVEKWWKDDQENDFGIDSDARNAGNEAEYEAGDDQDDGVGKLPFVRQGGEDDDEEE